MHLLSTPSLSPPRLTLPQLEQRDAAVEQLQRRLRHTEARNAELHEHFRKVRPAAATALASAAAAAATYFLFDRRQTIGC